MIVSVAMDDDIDVCCKIDGVIFSYYIFALGPLINYKATNYKYGTIHDRSGIGILMQLKGLLGTVLKQQSKL
jgi:hypothetical protein